ncbi:MAG: cytochrome c oxidase subunit II [Anaerolineae bacterium]
MTKERVLIISTHPLFRDGIIRLLGAEAEVVGAVKSWEEAKAIDPASRPQVIIVDHGDADLKETDLAPLLWPDAEDLRVIYVTLAGDKMTVHDRRHVVGASEADLLSALRGERPQSSQPALRAQSSGQPVPDLYEPQGRTSRMDGSSNGPSNGLSNRRHLIIVGALTLIVTVIVALLLRNVQLFQPPASTQAGPIDALMAAELLIIAFLFALIVVFMIYSVVVFRRKPGEDGDGVHFHGNTKLEITWTIIPLVVVLVLGFFAAQGLADVTRAADNELKVEVIAQQFAFRFNYPDQGIENSTELVLPVDQPLHLYITAVDVIHDFWVPEFRVKQDAVPGLVRELRLTPNKLGEYKVRCDELCGILHHQMLANVRVVEQSVFDSWVNGKVAEAAAGPQLSEAAQRGQELTVSTGCTACHNVTGEAGGIGPTWKGVFGHETELADGSTVTADEAYIKNSILNPNAQVVAGYPSNVMPQTYADQLTDEQINDIVEYIKSLGSE